MDRRTFLAASALGVSGLALGCSRETSAPSRVEISLDAQLSDVDLGGGVTARTWTWNGQVPGPQISLQRGQTLHATVTNALPAPTTTHWHGLAIPNPMDGVPVLTQDPIAAGADFTYEFEVPDAGTYWAHSHVGTQADRGLYAPLIITDPDDGADYDDELVIVLDDWIDGVRGSDGQVTDPDQVLAKLRATGMHGMDPGTGVTPSTPMGADGGDVTYPYFLVNGRVPADPQVVDHTAGQRIRLRIINAGSDTAFRVAVPDTPLTVTHTDGYPVTSTQTDSVLLGMGERADAIITVAQSVPVVAVPEAKPGHAQLNIRVGDQPTADVTAFVEAVRRQIPLDTATLHATGDVALEPRTPDLSLDLRLSGPVNGYTWPINGMLYNPPHDGLEVAQGQRVRLRLINESMMFHPIHLHGHTFEVVGTDGPLARKDTVLVAPMATVEVDFDAVNPGRWITHCHNTYHLEAGMGTFVGYAD